MWNEIRNENDIESLMTEYGGFHDSCIVSINYQSGAKVDSEGAMLNGELTEHTLDMVLHSQWNKAIQLHFTGVRKCNIVGWQDNYFCDIFGAYISFHNDLLGKTCDDKLIVWADDEYFIPTNYTEERLISPNATNCTYIIAEKLSWRMITEEN